MLHDDEPHGAVILKYCELIPNEKFFCTYLDMPLRKTEWHAGYYRRQIEQKILQPLEKVYGVDVFRGQPAQGC